MKELCSAVESFDTITLYEILLVFTCVTLEGVEEALQTERAAGAKALRWEQKGSREGGGGAGTCKPPRAGPRPSEATLHQVVEASG